jgi:hypothetical protein
LALFCFVIIALYPTLILGPGYLTKTGYPSDELTNGVISVVSEPAGADTFLDGISTRSHTPCLLAEIPPGPHTVMVSKAGYESESGFVEVFEGKTTGIKFILSPINRTFSTPGKVNQGSEGNSSFGSSGSGTDPGSTAPPSGDSGSGTDPGSTAPPYGGSESLTDGSIRVTSSTPGATIIINGTITGQITPATLVKSSGVYDVSVNLNGFQTPHVRTLTVISGQQVTVDFMLTPIIAAPEFPSLSFPAIVITVCAFMVCCIKRWKE